MNNKLDAIYKALGSSNIFKDICTLKKDGEINTSGYQLEKFQQILNKFNIRYKVLDIGYGFTIKLIEF